MHTYTPANSVFDGPITDLLSVLCVLVEVLSRAHAKREKSLNGFKFGTSTGRFSSDVAASTAVKGLKAAVTGFLTVTVYPFVALIVLKWPRALDRA